MPRSSLHLFDARFDDNDLDLGDGERRHLTLSEALAEGDLPEPLDLFEELEEEV